MKTILIQLKVLILSLKLLQVSLAIQPFIKNGNAKILVQLHEGLPEIVFVIGIIYFLCLFLILVLATV